MLLDLKIAYLNWLFGLSNECLFYEEKKISTKYYCFDKINC